MTLSEFFDGAYKFLEFVLTTLESFFNAIVSHTSADVVLITLIYIVIGFIVYKADKDEDDDFKMSDFFKTHRAPDPYKFGYLLMLPAFIWGFILLIEQDNMDWEMLILFFGFAFGPPMFFAAMKMFVSIKGTPEAIRAQAELIRRETEAAHRPNGNGENGHEKEEEKS